MSNLRSASPAGGSVPGSHTRIAGSLLAALALLAPGTPPLQAAEIAVHGASTREVETLALGTTYACAAEVGKLPIQLALRHYIKQAQPKPMRFLVAAGTDSALSDVGTKVLQEFGPMYYYAGSEAAKAKVRERLDIVGPFPALLVVRRTSPKPTATTEIIRLGGHYVTGEHDGKHAQSSEYTFVCGAAGWVMKGVKAEGSA